ncbi:MAG: hypothetical protein LBB89_02435 [Treponema sp.]|nr:hypothetical protein [Treponema sp.]
MIIFTDISKKNIKHILHRRSKREIVAASRSRSIHVAVRAVETGGVK